MRLELQPSEGAVENLARVTDALIAVSPEVRDDLVVGDRDKLSPSLKTLEMGEVETLTPIKLRYTGRVIDLVPIPGTKRRTYLEENVGALDVTLTRETIRVASVAVSEGARLSTATFLVTAESAGARPGPASSSTAACPS